MNDRSRLERLAALVRYYILLSTEEAGSGHPTSSLSAADLLTALFFGGFYRYHVSEPGHPNNDRLIFSKGHASPLLYALWAAAGQLSEDDLKTYRKFGSALEGHPTPRSRFVDVATGSLGQGLSIGLGMALNAKYLDALPYRTFVLLGDGEMAEGSQWEALQLAAHYRLANLVGILDVNGLGQSRETMYGRDLGAYQSRIGSFGWDTILVEDGHDMAQILEAFRRALAGGARPKMVIARTIKGRGVPSVEGRNGFHGQALGPERFAEALKSLGPIDKSLRGKLAKPEDLRPKAAARSRQAPPAPAYRKGEKVATRQAYGRALERILPGCPGLVVLDGEVSNSTGSGEFAKAHPERYFEMFIAEQNMVSAALGLSVRGRVPFVSTFAAFFSRAFDQLRMSQYSGADIKFCGSHAGVSIGQDGPSQMGLEDLAMFRSILGSTVLYPADAVAMERLVAEAAAHQGLVYLRSTRGQTPVIYGPEEAFPIGGHKLLRQGAQDVVAVVAAGITLFEALGAYETLKAEGLSVRVIDQYSVKPIDAPALRQSLGPVKAVLTVEDHHVEGGLGEAVASALAGSGLSIYALGVTRRPRSGTPEELLRFEDISQDAIAARVRQIASGSWPKRRPQGLKTRIFLDGADPEQTRQLLDLLGFLDGQTTNPTLVAKNPGVKQRLQKGDRFSEAALLEHYRNVVRELSELLPQGSISVEVYADPSTRAEEMVRMGRRMFSWIPNAHIKFPSSQEGIKAASQAVQEGLRVNLTLCFSQEQAAAVYGATSGAPKGSVFLSPFVGRLDDRKLNGMQLISDILQLYRGGDGHVEVLTASVRSLDQLLEALRLGSDIVTAPFAVLKEWGEKGMPLPDEHFEYRQARELKPIPYAGDLLSRNWRGLDVDHELTIKGEEAFSADWNALIERQPVAAL